jgi:hypothetical protein
MQRVDDALERLRKETGVTAWVAPNHEVAEAALPSNSTGCAALEIEDVNSSIDVDRHNRDHDPF